MIDKAQTLGLLAGAFAGCLHATMLWRASHRRSVWTPLLGLLRLVTVAVVLIIAAWCGQILPAAGGWMACFAACALVSLCWLPDQERQSPKTPPPK